MSANLLDQKLLWVNCGLIHEFLWVLLTIHPWIQRHRLDRGRHVSVRTANHRCKKVLVGKHDYFWNPTKLCTRNPSYFIVGERTLNQHIRGKDIINSQLLNLWYIMTGKKITCSPSTERSQSTSPLQYVLPGRWNGGTETKVACSRLNNRSFIDPSLVLSLSLRPPPADTLFVQPVDSWVSSNKSVIRCSRADKQESTNQYRNLRVDFDIASLTLIWLLSFFLFVVQRPPPHSWVNAGHWRKRLHECLLLLLLDLLPSLHQITPCVSRLVCQVLKVWVSPVFMTLHKNMGSLSWEFT